MRGNSPCRISPDTIISDRLTDTFIGIGVMLFTNIRWAPREHAVSNRSDGADCENDNAPITGNARYRGL